MIGQEAAKRALEIALAGGHNVLMIGPPGSGKTLLSEWMLHLLPPLTEREVVEVNRIYSAAGLLDSAEALHWRAPVRSPHHTITTRAMIGGGNPPAPGELSLAHRGLLILDEMALFRRATLDALREPLERVCSPRPCGCSHAAAGTGQRHWSRQPLSVRMARRCAISVYALRPR